jgi:radical SAM protein with 4Fe4S-binding SPASM domain
MKAFNSVPISKDKINLGKAAPIKTPFLIFMEPTSFCNFKCVFCPNSTVKSENKSFMPMEIFEKILHDLGEFPERPRVFKFCGNGEPLLNKHTPDMIRRIKETGSADRVILVSNGALLNRELNRKIVDAGLDQLNISVEALDEAGYMEFAGAKIDFGRFVENITDLYEHRKQLKIYVKIHNLAVKSDADKERFYSLFGDISDFIQIEGITHIFPEFTSEGEALIDRYTNEATSKRQVCAICFKTLNINADGSCSPCSTDWAHRVIVGDIRQESLLDIWNGEKLRELRRRFCTGSIASSEACFDCADYYLSGHEDLDEYASEILSRL